jgi:hypothetical protein
MRTAELIERYRKAAIRYGVAIDAGKSRVANKAFDEGLRLSYYFRRGGSEMQRTFLSLLEDENVWVRYKAATYALEFAPSEAVPVLRKIAAGTRGIVCLLAETILKQWETGTLHLP